LGVEDVGGHDGSVFGEGLRQGGRKLEALEVVAICDHLGFFLLAELEHEILREPLHVAADLFIESFGGDSIECGEVGIEHDSFSPDDEDQALDLFHGHDLISVRHVPVF